MEINVYGVYNSCRYGRHSLIQHVCSNRCFPAFEDIYSGLCPTRNQGIETLFTLLGHVCTVFDLQCLQWVYNVLYCLNIDVTHTPFASHQNRFHYESSSIPFIHYGLYSSLGSNLSPPIDWSWPGLMVEDLVTIDGFATMMFCYSAHRSF